MMDGGMRWLRPGRAVGEAAAGVRPRWE